MVLYIQNIQARHGTDRNRFGNYKLPPRFPLPPAYFFSFSSTARVRSLLSDRATECGRGV